MNALIQWPILTERDYEAVNRVLRNGRLVGGSEARAFADEWATYLGVSRCLSVSSCTHALHLALHALGVRAGDEVIVPALTFCGSAAPIVLCGATPIFADVHPRTFNLDPGDVARRLTSKTRAIVPVHLHGLPCDIASVATAAPGIPIVEDACQAHGATANGTKVGCLGTIGRFSLNQVKPLGGGQGGMIVSNDGNLMDLACVLATHGGGEHVGFSYGITEMAAALARTQLLSLDEHNCRARANAHRLSSSLSGFDDLVPQEPPGFESTWHKYRLGTKRASKTNAVRAEIGDIPARDIHIGPSDFVAWLEDKKWCHIRIEGTAFGGTPINLDLKLEVWDSPNSAGVVTDLVRWCRVALDRKIGGPIDQVCSVYMKSPPQQRTEAEANADLALWASAK